MRCWKTLGAHDAEARAQIAEILGFRLSAGEAPSLRRVDSSTKSRTPTSSRLPEPGFSQAAAPDPSSAPRAALLRQVPIESRPQASPAGDYVPPWRLDPVPHQSETTSHLGFQPSFDPLLDVRWTRAVVGALCAVMTRDGPVDMLAVVDRLARYQPLTHLPLSCRPTLRRGIQLLVDDGPGMMPFMRDVRELSSRITQVVGVDRTQQLTFTDHPLRREEVSGGPDAGKGYRLPASGTPVVVLSDFGLSRGARLRGAASVAEWLTFARMLRSAGCAVIGVVPLPRARWPRELAKAMKLVVWDRKTTVSDARRIASNERMR